MDSSLLKERLYTVSDVTIWKNVNVQHSWHASEHKPETVPSIPPYHYTSWTVILLGAVLSLKWPLSKRVLHHNSVFLAAYSAHYYLL
jgi:hypothetical protein